MEEKDSHGPRGSPPGEGLTRPSPGQRSPQPLLRRFVTPSRSSFCGPLPSVTRRSLPVPIPTGPFERQARRVLEALDRRKTKRGPTIARRTDTPFASLVSSMSGRTSQDPMFRRSGWCSTAAILQGERGVRDPPRLSVCSFLNSRSRFPFYSGRPLPRPSGAVR